LLVVVSIAIIAVVAILLANTADSGSTKASRGSTPGTPTTTTNPPLKLAIGTVDIQNTGPPAKIKLPVRRALLGAAQTYVDDAVLAPLRSGRVDNGYEKLFDPGLQPAASGKDRPALTEAQTGIARGPLHATASPVRLDGIGDQNGKIALVATTFAMTVKATTPVGPLTIHRSEELTFENQYGRWVVTAYSVGVIRTVGAKVASTDASTAGATGPSGAAA
jgi:hypothetical protein